MTYQNFGRERDLEDGASSFFHNSSIKTLSWDNIGVSVKVKTGSKTILDGNGGQIQAGQVLALVGPSGSGKSTLLNVLARRTRLTSTGTVRINGISSDPSLIRRSSSYVEQSDMLIGGLTVGESIDFSSRLASPTTDKAVRRARNDDILASLGLLQQKNLKVSPLLQAGISGGQRRRLSLGTALITGPKILFLDEPTSGLDSAASHQVVSFLSKIAKRYRLLIITSIHQPSCSTFDMFDLVTLISKGRMCYHGPRTNISAYFGAILPALEFRDSADHLLDLVNTDFDCDEERQVTATKIFDSWEKRKEGVSVKVEELQVEGSELDPGENQKQGWQLVHKLRVCWILTHRNFVKSYRDPLVYGTRLAINICLSLVIGFVWWRLGYEQASIQTFVNCIFFSSAFMALMVVAYAPPVIGDIQMLQKEHASNLYGAVEFQIANIIVGLPWLFVLALFFSTVVYWLSNLHSSAPGFFIFTLWLYADLCAAESLMVLISAIAPQFVTALALVSCVNGLWLAVDGFLVPTSQLNVFWKYAFHYINFQTYVFQGLMVNQFKDTTYNCETLPDGKYHCMYISDMASEGKVNGRAVLDVYDYSSESSEIWSWVGYTIAIIVVHRIIGMLVLSWRATRR